MLAYLVTDVNGKRYIGITSVSLKERWQAHIDKTRRGGKTLLCDAIRSLGREGFTVEHIASASSWSDLIELERILIAQYDTFFLSGYGYNMTLGGEGRYGSVPTTDSKLRTSVSLKGKKKTLQHAAAISAGKKGQAPTAEVLQAAHAASRGRVHSQAEKDARAASNRGKIRTAEQCRRIAAARSPYKTITDTDQTSLF